MVGDVSKGFFVNVEGYLEMSSVSANITSMPAQPVIHISKRVLESPQDRKALSQ